MNQPVILYDGFCNLCNYSTRTILRFDHKKQFEYVPLQSPDGQKILSDIQNIPDTVILYYHNNLYLKSDAVLKISTLIGFPLSILAICYIFPRTVRDYVYDLIARYRYKIFGKKDYCTMHPEDKKRRPGLWSPIKNMNNDSL
ncbi:thiol-disulfide oxidoreductase DCC family protein [Saccharicrinis sp. FJH54]|uniref:thiol-disulfide oxidoreductase DCC family protein n=1 Tax=Saccharicrinis sp. FJH54 TaxID=3344665 RepID=UPI0035D3FFA9